jgi:histidinol-phosphate aminotransferase
MGYAIDRRQWIKTSAMALAGLMTAPRLDVFPQQIDDIIMLHNNESPFGISPKAISAITDTLDRSNRYPHKDYPQLIDLIAKQENVPPDHIILGGGSTDVMVTLIHLAQNKGELLVGDPTYFDFIYYANMAGCALNRVPLNSDFEHDLEGMKRQISPRTGMIYICNPNNPTGSITPKNTLKLFCEHASKRALVVVDEAYHEYVEDQDYASMIDLVKQKTDIVVTRTFSKIFGLAGLRIGYGIALPETIEKLNRLSRNFAPISWLSLQAAIASYKDRAFIRTIKEKNREMRRYLYQELEGMGFTCVPSHTNFVLFQIGQDARDLADKLEKRKILVRPFVFHGRQWIRVSCGTKDELQAFLSALKTIMV